MRKEKFNEGINGKKADARQLAKEMMTLKNEDGQKMFHETEYLKWTQIASFFSRMSADLTKKGAHNRGTTSEISRTSIDETIGSVLKRVV